MAPDIFTKTKEAATPATGDRLSILSTTTRDNGRYVLHYEHTTDPQEGSSA